MNINFESIWRCGVFNRCRGAIEIRLNSGLCMYQHFVSKVKPNTCCCTVLECHDELTSARRVSPTISYFVASLVARFWRRRVLHWLERPTKSSNYEHTTSFDRATEYIMPGTRDPGATFPFVFCFYMQQHCWQHRECIIHTKVPWASEPIPVSLAGTGVRGSRSL